MSNVTEIGPRGGTTPDGILRDAMTAARRDAAAGARVGVVVGHVAIAPDGTRFYEVTYSEMDCDALLWLSKRIEREAVEDEDWGD